MGVSLWMDSIWPSVITWHMPSYPFFTMCNKIAKLVAPPSFVVWFLLYFANCRFQSLWYHIKKENWEWNLVKKSGRGLLVLNYKIKIKKQNIPKVTISLTIFFKISKPSIINEQFWFLIKYNYTHNLKARPIVIFSCEAHGVGNIAHLFILLVSKHAIHVDHKVLPQRGFCWSLSTCCANNFYQVIITCHKHY